MVLYVHKMANSNNVSKLLLKHALSAGYCSSASKTEPCVKR